MTEESFAISEKGDVENWGLEPLRHPIQVVLNNTPKLAVRTRKSESKPIVHKEWLADQSRELMFFTLDHDRRFGTTRIA